jgi:hypothetical protein
MMALPALELDGRSKILHMNSDASVSLSKSIPVVRPNPCNMYTKSSVATLPVAPLAYGHPPNPAADESIVRISKSNATKILFNACPLYKNSEKVHDERKWVH